MGVRRSVTGLLAGTLGCLVALVLGGCGGDDSVADPPVSPTTSSPTQAPHRESAEHFIRRFYAEERAMENSGNTGSYRALTHSCKSCASLARQVATFYRDGGYVQWGGFRIDSIKSYSSDERGDTFAVKGKAEPTTYKESSGAKVSRIAGGGTTELVTVTKANGSWLVTGFAKLGTD